MTYTPNLLNQYSTRIHPSSFNVLGVAQAATAVTVDGQSPVRQGEYFWKEISVNNASVPIWKSLTVSPTGGSGAVFLPPVTESFAYDLDGNLTQDSRWNYTWDAENRLIKMVTRDLAVGEPPRTIEFDYDAQGRRIRKTVRDKSATPVVLTQLRYLYDGWNLLCEVDAAGAWRRKYTWGRDLSGGLQGAGGVGGLLKMTDSASSTEDQAAVFDGNGNLMALVRLSDTSFTAQYEYGPFGELIRSSGSLAKGNPIRFSTKYQDEETDLLYYGYRYYNVGLGRWLGRDPIGEGASRNLCLFVRNNGINGITSIP